MSTGSQAAYARYKGVSKQTVTDWKSIGLVVFDEEGVVDFVATDASLVLHGIRQPVDAEDDASTLEDMATRMVAADGKELWSKADAEKVKENYAARLKQLEYDKESGIVVAIDDVVVAVASEYAVVRNRLLGIGSKVAPTISVLQSPEEIKAIIDAEVVEALSQLTVDVDGERDLDKLRESIQSRFGPSPKETPSRS
ncbi:hypothetical protein [Rhizobium laguerreae]|uniref:hypothetical protein n=1 Tax=Rhizobium laguerreae TaxID=1076926 RepID=UPI001C9000A1|nr:hypothetical protein [Rhizobium laguerreae]MBY3434833.1 hypothetical protein [Rhizobium laguerreae]MBY3448976.1 hypothetical protein [Rhizobium laguerreae]MBY3456750.1 hypothetical protein [Rhizobium laguerreae]